MWQKFDRTHTGEKPIHVQAMQQKILFAETLHTETIFEKPIHMQAMQQNHLLLKKHKYGMFYVSTCF